MPKTSSIRSSVSTELRLVTDTDRRSDGHRAMAIVTALAERCAGKTTQSFSAGTPIPTEHYTEWGKNYTSN